ncbi:MAG TPA: 50S ribosomal protein L17 [Bacteroidota bacterium]|jgi:large subunit ribosomal protein L17|nr:50S ribosomal protein L17 [Bacteroidota bacterium]
MRHRKAGRKLKRTASHRRATLAALATSLLRHKRITTTVAKAKETRMVVEKIITRARKASAHPTGDARGVHARREVGRLIKDRTVIGELFSSIASKVGSRPGGYTRIVKLGQRPGDGAEMAVIELVDFNTGQEEPAKPATPAKAKKPRQPKKEKPAGETTPAAEKKKKKSNDDAPVKKKDSSTESETKKGSR